jgi:hypothetical protein
MNASHILQHLTSTQKILSQLSMVFFWGGAIRANSPNGEGGKYYFLSCSERSPFKLLTQVLQKFSNELHY